MISRRIFLQERRARAREPRLRTGVRRPCGGAPRTARRQDADHDLPARRRRRPEHDRALRRARLLRGATDARDCAAAAAARMRRSISTASSASIRGSRRSRPGIAAGQLAVVHACGSPDATRSHFDAQDYMETATPGVKSTPDGWLNRYLHAREHEAATPFRAVALAPQLPRALQGTEPALAIGQIGHFGIRGGSREWTTRRLREPVRRRRATRAAHDRPGSVRGRPDAEGGESAAVHARQRRGLPAIGIRPGTAPDRAARQGGRRPRDRVRRVGELGSPRQPGSRNRSARQPARRSRPRPRRARPRSRRPHAGRRHSHHVGVRPRGRRERQPRHRPRPRQRHAGARRRASAAAASTGAGPASHPSSGTTAATSPSPPTSAPCSPKSCAVISA